MSNAGTGGGRTVTSKCAVLEVRIYLLVLIRMLLDFSVGDNGK